jgi:broad specificity phosphatase PhoE
VQDPYDAPPGGESVVALVERVRRWLAGPPGGVAVTHPAVVRAALVVVREADPAAYRTYDVRPLDRVRLVATERGWRDLP